MLMHGLLLAFSCFAAFGFGATLLPDEEVAALRQIAQTLGKNWNFSTDPCSGESGWVGPTPTLGFVNAVTCNCSYQNNTVCHIVSIVLTGQNLQGVLPPELVNLPYLQEIDLRRNYLNGTIPKEWGSMQLVTISLLGNRLSGPIPKEIGNISTLKELRLIANQFSGTLPPELGNLVNLEQLRISGNHFTGKIPDFIQNWTQLEELQIQGSGLQGPIPFGISLLKNLTELRISDINGMASAFPLLSNMKEMNRLILRNCNLTGPIPEYIWAMAKLGTL
ncbi:putative leucine-rich repeat receptor-like serine/threonine-protein kinase [Cinnamomum micranthum f. kanehirae]|uniref:Putative leucine-rich repeat receptor-like serine/threonine-protein kinase n=1 Tax=Cinnamomum micranthum f. kanehirae TaxID=337451 RepID=A0A3S4PY10_9MAGN|nr:putative leucine-rich repeat receptor-like serine/threonine-protein kinase [Cinnamomum micranthum f. kanehirae]